MFPIADVAHGFSTWLGIPIPVVTAALTSVFVSWACWRARSTYPFLKQMWKLLMGRAVASDVDIARFVQAYEDLLRFRFLFGLPVRTLGQAKALQTWAAHHDEGLEQIRACGKHFDIDSCELLSNKIPGRLTQLSMFVLLVGLTFSSVLGIAGTTTDRAVLQFKASRTWFLLAPIGATRLNGQSWSASSCSAHAASAGAPFSSAERAELCKAFSTPETASFIRETVLSQRWSFGTLTVGVLIGFVYLQGALRQAVAAEDLRKRLEKAAVRRAGTTTDGRAQEVNE